MSMKQGIKAIFLDLGGTFRVVDDTVSAAHPRAAFLLGGWQ